MNHDFKIAWINNGVRETVFENGPNYRVVLAKLGISLTDCVYIKRVCKNGNVLEEIYSNSESK
jgi:hypothetical protein